jgi:DNA-binding transcriptional LysR family regulator
VTVARFKTLLAIAECGTFVDAAVAVHRTPAAVSQQMKHLEAEMGATLFDRTRRPPEFTPAGYALISKARELVRVYETLSETLSESLSSVEELTIGPVPTTMTELIPKALKSLQENFPRLHVRVFPSLSADLYTQVDRGFLDAAIITEPVMTHDHLKWRPFAAEPLVLVAPMETEIEDPVELLENYPFIRFARRAWVGRIIDEWLHKNNVHVHEAVEIDSLEAVASWAFHNLGVSIIPQNCCLPSISFPVKNIALPRSKPRILGVLSRRDSTKDKNIKNLWDSLIQCVQPSVRIVSAK